MGTESIRARDVKVGDELVESDGALLTVNDVLPNGNYVVIQFGDIGSMYGSRAPRLRCLGTTKVRRFVAEARS